VVRVSHDALRLIQTYDWPGNVAELLAVLRRALMETKGTVLASDYLRRALRNINEERRSPSPAATNGSAPISAETITDWPQFVGQRIAGESSEVYAEAMAEMERHVLREVLAHTAGNQAHAARILGITRTSLRKKIHLLGINIGRVVTAG
jgi:two-component system nitrogen regulation response regulator GlnG